MEFILNGCKEGFGELRLGVIIYASRKYVADFSVKNPLAAPYVADSGQQLVEVAVARLFEAFIVEHKTFDNVFTKALCCPNAKMRADLRFYAVSNRDDDIEVVKRCFEIFAIGGSCSEIPNN